MYRKGNFWHSTDQQTHLTTPTQLSLRAYQLQLASEPHTSDQITGLADIYHRLATDNSDADQLCSLEDLMDFLPLTSVTVQSTQSQTDEQVDVHEGNRRQELVSTFTRFARTIKN